MMGLIFSAEHRSGSLIEGAWSESVPGPSGGGRDGAARRAAGRVFRFERRADGTGCSTHSALSNDTRLSDDGAARRAPA